MNLDVLMSACRQSGGEHVAEVIDLLDAQTVEKIILGEVETKSWQNLVGRARKETLTARRGKVTESETRTRARRGLEQSA